MVYDPRYAEDDLEPEDLVSLWVQDGLEQGWPGLLCSVSAYRTPPAAAIPEADVRPVVLHYRNGRALPIPTVYAVPVAWPSGGGAGSRWSLTGPLAPGDHVWLRPSAQDLDDYLGSGQTDQPPPTRRRGALADMVADPGAPRPQTQALPPSSFAGDGPVLAALVAGYLGSAAAGDRIALASKVEAELNRIITHVNSGLPGLTPTVPLATASLKWRAD